MERDEFYLLVDDRFGKRYGGTQCNDWATAWQNTVQEIYDELSEEDRKEVGLYYCEAMDMDEAVRCCSHCGKPMKEGYYLGGEYACSDECCLALYGGDMEQMKEDLSHAEDDDSEVYWTEWESYFFD